MCRLILPTALALAVLPASHATQRACGRFATDPPVTAASTVRTSTSVPGAFAPGTAGWDVLGAGIINLARLVRGRRRPA